MPIQSLRKKRSRFLCVTAILLVLLGTVVGFNLLSGGVTTQSRYVPMRDGAKIAIDVLLPKDAAADARFPTILIMTRYWRSFALRGLTPRHRAPMGPRDPLADLLVAREYAVVTVDARGSGASTGSNPYPFSAREIQDYGEVVDWVIGQPWSDGHVGATGISYEGTTAQLLSVAHPTATKVVIPQEIELDLYTETLCPGGVPNEWFVNTWHRTNTYLDANRVPPEWGWSSQQFLKGVRPVDEDREGALLRQAVADHARNPDFSKLCKRIIYRDDPWGSLGVTVDDFTVAHYREPIERSGAAIFHWGSWLDGSSADAVIRQFATYTNPQRAMIGAWSHRYQHHASPYCPPGSRLRPDKGVVWQEILQYFDAYLKGAKDAAHAKKQLIYYTMGEEGWKATDVWPPAGSITQRWYLNEQHLLSREAAQAERGADSYTVNFAATTGAFNRWHTMDGMTKVVYPDRADADRLLLTYTSLPLSEDMEVTGHPVVTLQITSTADDGAFYVYLEDVDEHGKVVYVTEGQLRVLHRRISNDEPSHTLFVPYHSFLRRDAMPLVPGKITTLQFGLLPTSTLIRKGHRLRIAIAGHDKDTFARIPATGEPTITVQRNRRYASYIDLPVMRRTQAP